MNEMLTQINGIPIRGNFVEYLPYNPHLKKILRKKRQAGILSEVIFQNQLEPDYVYLKSLNLKIFRITDFDVKNDLSLVMKYLVALLFFIIGIDHHRNLKFTISNLSPHLEGNFPTFHYHIFFKLNIFKTFKIET